MTAVQLCKRHMKAGDLIVKYIHFSNKQTNLIEIKHPPYPTDQGKFEHVPQHFMTNILKIILP